MALDAPAGYAVIPLPAEMNEAFGTLRVEPTMTLDLEESFTFANRELAKVLKEAGIRGTRGAVTGRGAPGIIVRTESPSDLGEEGYRLDIDAHTIRIKAHQPAGAYYAIQTLRQLFLGRGQAPFDMPSVQIVDYPRFEWRGMHLDVSRHFFPAPEIKKYIDYIAELKMNIFHWHLVDDGGWRMEVKKYPLLTQRGAWRTDLPGVIWSQGILEFPGPNSSKKLYGGFYTQEEIREIVNYATERNITIIPEIEMPGHCLPALEAYPELGCDIQKREGENYKTNVFCAGKERSLQFLRDVLDETIALFPSRIIHIGGDEVDKSYWSRCPTCNSYMKAKGLKDYNELQSDFIKRAEVHLNSRGRTLIGWDEILEGGLAPNAMVMSWRGIEGGIAAAKAGHDVVMSPTNYCYFDYSYDSTPTEKVYGYEPIPRSLAGAEAYRVKGAQANVWTEWIPDFDRVEYMIFPRMLAMAEVLWTPSKRTYFPSFKRRLEPHYRDFIRRGIDFYVGRPAFDANLIVFKDTTTIALEEPALPSVTLRYTMDGSDPKSTSPKLEGPLKVDRSARLAAAYMRGNTILESVARVTAIKGAPWVTPVPGIDYKLVKAKLEKLPNWSTVTPAEVGRATSFSIAPFTGNEAFGVQWRSFLKVDREGLYTFTLGSDDGSVLRLAGATVVDNDGQHAYSEKIGRARLLPGVYALEVGFFEAGGARRFEAWIEGPGFSKRKLEEAIVK